MALGDYKGMIIGWLLTPAIWGVLIFIFLLGTIGILYMRKKKRLQFQCVEIVDLNTRAGFNFMKAGYFGKKKYLNGLWWTGEEVLTTATGEIIHNFSTEDFQEVNGERGVVCYRDPLKQNVLVPISNLEIKNKHLIATIAPADYTDVAVDIIRDASAETSDWRDKMIQFGSWALVVIFSLIAIIVITQMIKNGQKEASDLIVLAGDKGAQVCKEILSTTLQITQSTSGAP